MDPLLLNVPSNLFTPAESDHFEGEMNLSTLEANSDTYVFSDPITWQVDVSNTGNSLLVRGSAQGVASTACVRCLEEATFPLKGEIEAYFLLEADDEEDEEPGDEVNDEFEVLPDDHVIDMAPLINAALLLELPLIPLCKQDCLGLCPTCGVNLNEEKCDCVDAISDDDVEQAENPFSVLKDLKLDED